MGVHPSNLHVCCERKKASRWLCPTGYYLAGNVGLLLWAIQLLYYQSQICISILARKLNTFSGLVQGCDLPTLTELLLLLILMETIFRHSQDAVSLYVLQMTCLCCFFFSLWPPVCTAMISGRVKRWDSVSHTQVILFFLTSGENWEESNGTQYTIRIIYPTVLRKPQDPQAELDCKKQGEMNQWITTFVDVHKIAATSSYFNNKLFLWLIGLLLKESIGRDWGIHVDISD